jgi:hypothetical protein
MTVRWRTAEHVFGTFKLRTGYTLFLTHASQHEYRMNPHVLAYNLKRVLKILGFNYNEGHAAGGCIAHTHYASRAAGKQYFGRDRSRSADRRRIDRGSSKAR